jgi:hydrogenase nickel incorporation protein HypA/HybF
MHEVSIAQSILSIAEKVVTDKKITSVSIDVGVLSGIEIDALKSAFSFVKENTILNNAELIINQVNAVAVCNECGNEFELKHFATPCPACNSFSLKIIKGQEMIVTQIEIED